MSQALPTFRAGVAVDPPLRGEVGVLRFFFMHVLALVFPVAAGITLYGWRAVGALGLVVGATLVSVWAWRFVGLRGRRLSFSHAFWLALMLALMLPAHLATSTYPSAPAAHVWAVLPATGLG